MTPTPPSTPRLRTVGLLSFVLAAVTASGCGQVTGLSDDYTFDLADAAASSSVDAGDAGRDASAASDAGAGVDAGACQSSAATTLNNQGGTLQCRTCLANGCCNQVEACWSDSTCRNTLRCVLACSAENARAQCIAKCDGVNAQTFSAMSRCEQQACNGICL